MAIQRSLRTFNVLGVHQVHVSATEFDEAVATQWGSELSAKELQSARAATRDHFDGLRLIEVEIEPADAEFDWGGITQEIVGEPRGNWQSPYVERPLAQPGRWAFFFHFIDEARPLITPIGERRLPATTPCPAHLREVMYEVPG